jgi:prepilin-type N-terminal cleavage/methylation domain-containing protein
MKIPAPVDSRPTGIVLKAGRGFALPETLIVMAILSMLVAATVSSQIFGLKMYRISETKLTTTADARSVLNRIREEIRCGRMLEVGNGDSVSFLKISNNVAHIGNALRIFPTTDTNQFVYYYTDPDNARLNRMVSGSPDIEVVARSVTNRMVFQAEDYQGVVVTNYVNNRVIRMSLQFYHRNFAAGSSAGGGSHDYFQLQTRVARRAIE